MKAHRTLMSTIRGCAARGAARVAATRGKRGVSPAAAGATAATGRPGARLCTWGVRVSKIGKIRKFLQIFGGLVLGCIKTKFCKKICVRQHFSSSTRFAYFCTAAISKFSQKIAKDVGLKSLDSWMFLSLLQP